MKHSFIHFEEYEKYFKLFSHDCLSGFNNSNGYNYFFIQTYLPKKMLNESRSEMIFQNYNIEKDESTILVNLELCARGTLEYRCDIFLFKPWIVDEGQEFDSHVENALIIIPDYIFYNLLESEIFKERYFWSEIQNLDVVKTITEFAVEKYGFNNFLVKNSNQFETEDLNEVINFDKELETEKYELKVMTESVYNDKISEYYNT